MGFGDALTDLLGGFNAQRRIDTEGFDWREKAAQEELRRKQEAQQFGQANTDWQRKQEEADIAAGAEAALAPGGEDVLESFLPAGLDQTRRKANLARMIGRSAQSKSSLEAQKLWNQRGLQEQKDAARLEQIAATGEQREALARVNAELQAGREPSPRDLALLEGQGRNQQAAIRLREALRPKGAAGGKPQLRQVTNAEGEAVWDWIYPGQSAPVAPTAAERQTSGMAMTIRENIDDLRRLADPNNKGEGVLAFPGVGHVSKLKQSFFPSGNEGEFDAKAKQLIDIVYLKSGKQINQQEMKILASIIPTRGHANIDFQIKQFEDYANGLLRKYGVNEGAGAPLPKAGGRRRFGFDASGNLVEQ